MADDCTLGFVSERTEEKIPMHPEDFVALLAWVRDKETGRDKKKN
jgi:hypothetical protein